MKKSLFPTLILVLLLLTTACGSETSEKWSPDMLSENLSQPAEQLETMFFIYMQDRQIPLSGEQKTFNEQGFLTEEVRFGREHEFLSKVVYKNDEQGRPVSATAANNTGDINMSLEYAYNEDNRAKTLKVLDRTGRLVSQTVTTFDDQWRGVTEKVFDINGNLLHTVKNEYNDKGQLVKQSQLEGDGSVENEQEFTYNEKGELSAAHTYDAMGGEYDNTYTYEYDDKGNWTQKQTLLNGKVVELRIRKIKYRN